MNMIICHNGNIGSLKMHKYIYMYIPLDLEGLCSYWSKSESSVGCREPELGRGVSLAVQQQWLNQI